LIGLGAAREEQIILPVCFPRAIANDRLWPSSAAHERLVPACSIWM